MFVFISQAPILGVTVPVLLLVALLEAVGLKTRVNIAILSAVSLVCLGAAVFMHDGASLLAEILYATGLVLGVVLILYALVTACRGRQWTWFVGLLIAVIGVLGTEVVVRAALAQQDAEGMASLIICAYFPASGGRAGVWAVRARYSEATGKHLIPSHSSDGSATNR